MSPGRALSVWKPAPVSPARWLPNGVGQWLAHAWQVRGQRARLRPPVSNLPARVPRIALPGTASPRLPYRLSCGDVVRRIARDSGVWGPHSLHTAEATGSIPVTPTSQNASPPRSSGPFARRFARRSPPGGGRPWSAWLDPSRWRAGQQLGRGAAEPRRWRTCPIWLWEQGVASSRLRSGLLLG